MKFFGETCPVCGSIFVDGDDIVVCPECGTPSHRECWEKEGKCINEDKHGDFSWTPTEAEYVQAEQVDVEPPAPDSSVSKLCPFCSARNDEKATVCSSCGRTLEEEKESDDPFQNNPFDNNTFKSTEEIDGVEVSKIAKYVQLNYPRYIQKFKRLSEKKVSFNWAAFFLNPQWFFFRKLYYAGGIFLGVQILLTFLCSFLMTKLDLYTFMDEYMSVMMSANTDAMMSFMLDSILNLMKVMLISSISFIPNLIAGFTADRIYKHTAFKNIKKIENSDQPEHLGTYVKNGAGVSIIAAILSAVGYELLTTLLLSLL